MGCGGRRKAANSSDPTATTAAPSQSTRTAGSTARVINPGSGDPRPASPSLPSATISPVATPIPSKIPTTTSAPSQARAPAPHRVAAPTLTHSTLCALSPIYSPGSSRFSSNHLPRWAR
jgi:hypothetical protein